MEEVREVLNVGIGDEREHGRIEQLRQGCLYGQGPLLHHGDTAAARLATGVGLIPVHQGSMLKVITGRPNPPLVSLSGTSPI